MSRRAFERRLRKLLLRLVCLFLRSKPVDVSHRLPEPSRIILLRASHTLGDVIRVGAVLDECRRLFPRAHVTLLVHAQIAELFEGHPSVDELWKFDPHWPLKPLATFRQLRKLRHGKFDVALDCANPEGPSVNNWLVTRLADARYRVGMRWPDAEKFLNLLVEPELEKHFIYNQLRLLSPFGEPATFRVPRVALTEGEIKAARDFLGADWCEKSAKGRRVIFFIPRPNDRMWPMGVFLELADLLCRDGVRLLVSFGPGDERRDDPGMQALLSRWVGQIRLLPDMRLRQLGAVMSQCDLFISNDCGPMHLAVAVGTPTLIVFLLDKKHIAGYEDGKRYFVVTGADDRERLAKTHQRAREFLASMK